MHIPLVNKIEWKIYDSDYYVSIIPQIFRLIFPSIY